MNTHLSFSRNRPSRRGSLAPQRRAAPPTCPGPGAAGTDGSTFTSLRHLVSGIRHPSSIFHPPPPSLASLLLLTAATGLAQPVITQQPQSCTNAAGTTATFWVTATGTEPLAYQWQKLVATWANLADCTANSLLLSNVQANHAGDYRVVVTNTGGAATSTVATLTVVVAPRITPTAGLQHNAVFLGQNAAFSVTATGSAPLSYQWRRDGIDLAGKTGPGLTITAAQAADEGDYTVVVTNWAGAAASESTRLYVVPPVSQMIRGDFTNTAGLRLPYFYVLPTNYVSTHSYPLICGFHGMSDDETSLLSTAAAGGGTGFAWASYKQQAADPVIGVFPTRRVGDHAWTDQYLAQVSGLLDRLASEFSIDTNRIYVWGWSEGGHAVWDSLGQRPGFFAAGIIFSGWAGNTPAAAIKDVPLWAFHAADDSNVPVSNSRTLVRTLRQAGGATIYTEYNAGGHYGGIKMGECTPAAMDWCLVQRRSVDPTNEPLLTITSPTNAPVYRTGAPKLNLAGTAAALGQHITLVTWTNVLNNAKGTASGTDSWTVTNVPLVANALNRLLVVATTTSWAPAYGGNTTFNDTLTVIQSPLRATLTLQGANAVLNWTGGGPPYRVERATDLAAGDWAEVLPDATPPVLLPLPLPGPVSFYRVVGQ